MKSSEIKLIQNHRANLISQTFVNGGEHRWEWICEKERSVSFFRSFWRRNHLRLLRFPCYLSAGKFVILIVQVLHDLFWIKRRIRNCIRRKLSPGRILKVHLSYRLLNYDELGRLIVCPNAKLGRFISRSFSEPEN